MLKIWFKKMHETGIFNRIVVNKTTHRRVETVELYPHCVNYWPSDN